MKQKNGIRSAHMGSVNSVFVSFDACVVISFDEASIRIWDPVSGLELYESNIEKNEDSVVSGLSSIYRMAPMETIDA